MPTLQELQMLQALPLDVKIKKSEQRIIEFANRFGIENISVSWSGGKDSTVLLHIARRIFPNIQAAYVDTGLEYPELRKCVYEERDSGKNITILHPEMNFRQVIEKYGYPLISKETAETIYYARKNIESNGRLNTIRMKRIMGEVKCRDSYMNLSRYQPFLKSPFRISSACCDVMKKKPLKEFSKKYGFHPILGNLANESKLRETNWLRFGCNAFAAKEPKSTPLAFWTEEDILQYILENGVKIPSVYGLIYRGKDGKLQTSGVQRTGCMWCGFGAHRETKAQSRFISLSKTHPAIYDYCMRGGATNRWFVPSN